MILRLTTAGRTQLADGTNRGTRALQFTRIGVGDGAGPGGATDDARTALRSARDRARVTGSTTQPGRIALRADLTPTGTCTITEVGLFAQVGTDPEFLCAYWTADGEILAAAVPDVLVVIAAVVEIQAADAELTVTLSPTVTITGDRTWLAWPLGGEQDFQQTSSAYAEIKASEHVVLDGDALTGRTLTLSVMARVDGGEGRVRLYNVTDDAPVTGSWFVVTATTPTLLTSRSGFSDVAAGTNTYRVEAKKGTTWIAILGAKLIIS